MLEGVFQKTNYRFYTDSIKENIVLKLTDKQKQYIYADEADAERKFVWNDNKRMK